MFCKPATSCRPRSPARPAARSRTARSVRTPGFGAIAGVAASGAFRLRPRRGWFRCVLWRGGAGGVLCGSCGVWVAGAVAAGGGWAGVWASLGSRGFRRRLRRGRLLSRCRPELGTGPPGWVWTSNCPRSAVGVGEPATAVRRWFGIAVEQILLRAEQHQPHQSNAYQHPHQASQQWAARLRLSSRKSPGAAASEWLAVPAWPVLPEAAARRSRGWLGRPPA